MDILTLLQLSSVAPNGYSSLHDSRVLPFFGRQVISDCVAFFGWVIVHCSIFSYLKASIIPGLPCFRTSAGMLVKPGDLSFSAFVLLSRLLL